jgi:hypothetical protein
MSWFDDMNWGQVAMAAGTGLAGAFSGADTDADTPKKDNLDLDTKSKGTDWSPWISAGIKVVGGLVSGLAEQEEKETIRKEDKEWQREKFEWEKQQAELNRQDAAQANRLTAAIQAINARIQAAKLDPGLKGYSRQAERLQTGAAIDQKSIDTIVSGYGRYGGSK